MSLYSEWAKKRRDKEMREGYEKQEQMGMKKLSEWLESKNNKVTLFIDQDETLLVSRNIETVARMGAWANQHAAYHNIMGTNIGVIVRPGANEFLQECRRIAPTVILTAGATFFQEQVLEAVGLLNEVGEVFGRDRYHQVPKDRAGLLVDDRHPHDMIVQEKLNAMGGGLFLNVPAWHGLDKDDKVLSQIPPHIKKSLTAVL